MTPQQTQALSYTNVTPYLELITNMARQATLQIILLKPQDRVKI